MTTWCPKARLSFEKDQETEEFQLNIRNVQKMASVVTREWVALLWCWEDFWKLLGSASRSIPTPKTPCKSQLRYAMLLRLLLRLRVCHLAATSRQPYILRWCRGWKAK